jgi:hypothetical protein
MASDDPRVKKFKKPANYADPRVWHAPNAFSEVARQRGNVWSDWPKDEAEVVRRIEAQRQVVVDVLFNGARPEFDEDE